MTKDLDPPGFESLAPFIRAVPTTRQPQTVPSLAANKSAAATKTSNVARIKAERRLEETRTTKLAAARGLLQKAKKLLVEASSKAQSLAAALKKAEADRKRAEKEKREAEQRFKEASTAAAEASVRAHNLARESERAAQAVNDAEREVKRTADELTLI